MASRFSPGARVVLAMGVLLALGAAAPGAALASAQAAPAAPVTFTVNSINDAVADFTSDPAFDVCRTSFNNTTCTLRAAIMNANRHAGGAIIHLPSQTYTLTLSPSLPRNDSDGGLEISNTVTLLGGGAASTILDANALDNALLIFPGAAVTITGLTIRNGHAPGLNGGGGIDSVGQLHLTASVLRDNDGGPFGGGLENGTGGTATLTDVTITHNRASSLGGGILNGASLTLNASTVDNNTATKGGGIYNDSSGSLTLFDSTLSNNSAVTDGGALANLGSARIFHTTIAGNLAGSQNTSLYQGGGIINTAPIQSVQVWNSILADNYAEHFPSQCAVNGLKSQGYNYINFNGSCPLSGTTTGNIVVVQDPVLGELADNGGPTLTRALTPGSLVIDQIPPAVCQDQFATAPVPDQRGVARPVGLQCDMGAFEGQVATPIFNHNLVRNGDAEASAGSSNGAWVGVPDWTVLLPSQMTLANYNPAANFPSVVTQTVPANHGENLFAGGMITNSDGFQRISFVQAGINSAVDAGAVSYVLSADLGGFGTQNDSARVLVQFVDLFGIAIGPTVALNGPNAAGRGQHTSLLPFHLSGVVPPLARGLIVTLSLHRASGADSYNNGYADNLSFVLVPTPLFLPVLLR